MSATSEIRALALAVLATQPASNERCCALARFYLACTPEVALALLALTESQGLDLKVQDIELTKARRTAEWNHGEIVRLDGELAKVRNQLRQAEAKLADLRAASMPLSREVAS
jgi:hypothetical protein